MAEAGDTNMHLGLLQLAALTTNAIIRIDMLLYSEIPFYFKYPSLYITIPCCVLKPFER